MDRDNEIKTKNFNKNFSPDIMEVSAFSDREASETLLLLSNNSQTPTRYQETSAMAVYVSQQNPGLIR